MNIIEWRSREQTISLITNLSAYQRQYSQIREAFWGRVKALMCAAIITKESFLEAFELKRNSNYAEFTKEICTCSTPQYITQIDNHVNIHSHRLRAAFFCSKIQGKISVTASVTYERRVAKPRATRVARGFAYHARTHMLFCVLPSFFLYGFSSKRETARSLKDSFLY